MVQAVPLCQRQTQLSLAAASGIPRTTLQRYLADGTLRRAASRLKPALTAGHKTKRLQWALAHVDLPLGGRMYRMHHMYDTVHIDEKWFNLYKGTTKYYLTASEQLLYRTCPNKKYIAKVMFLAVVARPRYDFHRKQHFDGKIGIWPIVEKIEALRSSINRPKGSMITKNESMTITLYRKFLVEKVFPSIRAKMPARRWSTVVVQQDNAGPHVLENDAELEIEGKVDGWSIKMRCQPPRSPDLNVLDLGFFLLFKHCSTEGLLMIGRHKY
ncbi:hypothetical protein L914_01381 [Phytophthora nicotianae]|uniref:Transposase Tc1-like domain-containing protein n=1 Tax=Phytophthora nicotianae TaxID=4792 RepID=W2P3K0_PHYNI|nr:hypothetical protein L914_01381 [Phytophthora nicotianae]